MWVLLSPKGVFPILIAKLVKNSHPMSLDVDDGAENHSSGCFALHIFPFFLRFPEGWYLWKSGKAQRENFHLNVFLWFIVTGPWEVKKAAESLKGIEWCNETQELYGHTCNEIHPRVPYTHEKNFKPNFAKILITFELHLETEKKSTFIRRKEKW